MEQNNPPEEFKFPGKGSVSNNHSVAQRLQSQQPDAKSDSILREQQMKYRSSRPKKRKKINKDNNRRKNSKKKVVQDKMAEEDVGSHQKNYEGEADEFAERGLTTIKPSWQSAQGQSLQNFHQQIDKFYFCSITNEHLQPLKQLAECKLARVSELLNEPVGKNRLNQDKMQKYIQFLKDTSKQAKNQVVVLFEENNRYLEIFYKTMGGEEGSEQGSQALSVASWIQLNQSQYDFLKLRQTYLTQVQSKLQQYNNDKPPSEAMNLDQLSKQLLFYNNLLSEENRRVELDINNIKNKVEHNVELICPTQQEIYDIEDNCIRLVLKKNFINSIRPRHIEITNYFRNRAAFEQNKQLSQLNSTRELIDYIRKKMVRKNKRTKSPLATGCMGCLSDRYEQCNPFKNCYECGSRFHKNCLLITNNACTVCDSKRLRRAAANECELCPNRGLMYKPFTDNRNIHIWCMLAYGLYSITNKQVTVKQYDIELNTDEEKCFLCSSNKGKLVGCCCFGEYSEMQVEERCQKLTHPLCAYMSGHHLQLKDESIEFNCSINSQPQTLIEQEFVRKYTINYNRLAYKYFSLEDFERSKLPKQSNSSEPAEQVVVEEQQQPQLEEGEAETTKKLWLQNNEQPFLSE